MDVKKEPLKATLGVLVMVASLGWNDAAFIFFKYRVYTHIGRDYMQPPYLVKGIMQQIKGNCIKVVLQ